MLNTKTKANNLKKQNKSNKKKRYRIFMVKIFKRQVIVMLVRTQEIKSQQEKETKDFYLKRF